MRLGEIKQKIDKVRNASGFLEILSENFSNLFYQVKNYDSLIEILRILSKYNWSEIKNSDIDVLLVNHPENSNTVFSSEDFNLLAILVDRVNSKLPFYYSILETMVTTQDQYLINIKLPNSIQTLGELTSFNQRIEKIFKKFQIDGQFEFRQFDKGTSWYEIQIIGVLTYNYFLASLKIAQEYLKTKNEYFKSKEAKISYETYKKTDNNLTLEVFQKEWLETFIREEIKTVVEEKIKETNGDTKESLHTKLVIATTDLVRELGEGTEFHLSLNPPDFATEQAGQLIIDYKKNKALKSEQEIKKIEPKKESKSEE